MGKELHVAGNMKFIDALQCGDNTVSIIIDKMTEKQAQWWDKNIHTIIRDNYVEANHEKTGKGIRADASWEWVKIKRRMDLYNKFWFKNFRTETYCIKLKTEDSKIIPIGMIAIAPQFNCKIDGIEKDRGFLWYFSDAPKEFYDQISIEKIKGIPKVAIDTTIIRAINKNLTGEILLRCAREGGEKLTIFYRDKCRMTQPEKSTFNPGIIRKIMGHSHDSFYYFSDTEAIDFSRKIRANIKETHKLSPEWSHHQTTNLATTKPDWSSDHET